MFGLYGLLLRLGWAIVLPYQFVIAMLRGQKGPRLGERLARAASLAGAAPGGFWVHAVSVGEVRLALFTIQALRTRFRGVPVHLTTCTETGRALALEAARAEAGTGPDSVSDLPFDLPGPMGRFLRTLHPKAILIIETEIWPNLLRSAGAGSVPVVLLNGRISPRSFPRYFRIRVLLRRVLPSLRLALMQSSEDAARLIALGARPEKIRVTGNMKFDLPVPRTEPAAVRARLGIGPDEFVLVAGSTARGEEEAIVQAFTALRQRLPVSRLLMAPRHPADWAPAAEATKRGGFVTRLWSEIGPGTPQALAPYDVLIVDVIGVLPEIYAAASVAFVGGSLVPRGGQNLLEPAALAKPVLFGPRIENVQAAADALRSQGGGFLVQDAGELAGLVLRLATNGGLRAEAGARALGVVEANRGALRKTLDLLEGALRPGEAAAIGGRVAART